ncbi:MAG: general secretion pathway protein GspK [Pseudomonadota bacterium]
MRKRRGERGLSLLNVLIVVAAGDGLVQVMLATEEGAIDQLANAQAGVQARALADAGVTSVAVALRRDAQDAPDADHLQETWAQSQQDEISVGGGTFAVAVSDLRGRFDLNSLGSASFVETRVFNALLAQLDLPESVGVELARLVTNDSPLQSISELQKLGFSDKDIRRLSPHVTVLPTRHRLNINTATERVLVALFSNPAAARSLVARRDARGFLDASDLSALGLAMPPLAGFTSDAFEIRTTAEYQGVRRTVARIVLRDLETGSVSLRPAK